jgi:hypothetical protein
VSETPDEELDSGLPRPPGTETRQRFSFLVIIAIQDDEALPTGIGPTALTKVAERPGWLPPPEDNGVLLHASH